MTRQVPSVDREIEKLISKMAASDHSNICQTVERPLAGLEIYPEALNAHDLAYFDKLASKASTAQTLYSEYGSDWRRGPDARPLTEAEMSILAFFFLLFGDPQMVSTENLDFDMAHKFLNAGLCVLDRLPANSLRRVADDRLSRMSAQ